MKNFLLSLMVFIIFTNNCFAKINSVDDTIKIKIGNSINITIQANDSKQIKNNLETIMNEIKKSVEQIESTGDSALNNQNPVIQKKNKNNITENIPDNIDDANNYWEKYKNRFKKEDFYNDYKFVRYFLFFEIGFCNYLENGFFPNDKNKQYAASQLGSSNINFGGTLRLRFVKVFSINFEYGLGWNNYHFQDKSTILIKADSLYFSQRVIESSENYEFKKSRLSVFYMNFGIIPMFHISKIDYSSNNSKVFKMRLGIGVFGGYRIGANIKYLFSVDEVRHKYREKKDFYINSYHYGIKALVGFGETFDIFVTYDLNPLFVKDKGPKLNTICLGARINL